MAGFLRVPANVTCGIRLVSGAGRVAHACVPEAGDPRQAARGCLRQPHGIIFYPL